jgi:hypothetical protein
MGVMRRAAVIVAVGLSLAACAEESPPGTPRSGLTGKVVVYPTCPQTFVESPCPERGVQTTVAIEPADGDGTTQVRTQPDGTFRVALEPGDYLLSAAPPATYPHLIPQPASATVEPGTFARVRVVLEARLSEP